MTKRKMARRNAVRRQKALDDDQTKEAMKVLEKYCRKKYRHSVLENEQPNTTTSEPFNNYHMPRQFTFDRQSTAFSTPFFESRPPLSPAYTFDFTEHHSVKDEIRFDKTKETWAEYLWRILQFFYRELYMEYALLLIVLVIYALLGGYIFYSLESPNEILFNKEQHRIASDRHHEYSAQIVKLLAVKNCTSEVLSFNKYPHEYQLVNKTYTFCEFAIRNLLIGYDSQIKRDLNITPGWEWDYWNAVFYSGTLFTTIGYGNLSCRTRLGQFATILYALVGVPLMLIVLNKFGQRLFSIVQGLYDIIRRKTRKHLKKFRRTYFKRTATVESVNSDEVADLEHREDMSEDSELFETFPISLALFIVFIYILLCAVVFSLWEEWDYFTSFYFFFISLSTIGLGDVMPNHPKYACSCFLPFIIGLALVSMFISIIQLKVENKYMAALQLIDQEHQEILENIDNEENISGAKTPNSLHPRNAHPDRPGTPKDEPVDVVVEAFRRSIRRMSEKSNKGSRRSLTGTDNPAWSGGSTPGSVRWRSRDNSESEQTGCQTRNSQYFENPVDNGPPPVLGVFMARSMSTKGNHRKSIVGSENISSKTHRLRPFSYASDVELTPSTPCSRSPWSPSTLDLQSPTVSASPMPENRRAGGSAPNLASQRPIAHPLSVITEGDEESSQSRASSKKKRPPVLTLMRENSVDIDSPQIDHPLARLSSNEDEENNLSWHRKRGLIPPTSLSLRSINSPAPPMDPPPLPPTDRPDVYLTPNTSEVVRL